MPKTRINCPNCRQPIPADIEQLFDAGADPQAKARLLSGAFNLAACPHCGYRGNLATPIVYHDPAKELLLTFVPPELGLPMQEQERIIGPLLTKVMSSLPPEKRKAYLLRPQTMLTLQGLLERILEGDGVTKEMVQAQQKRLNLLQRLAAITTEDVLAEVVKQEEKLMDAEFYTLFNRLIESAAANGDRASATRLSELQRKLLPLTAFGRQLLQQSQEMEEAVKSLREAGKGLTREKLLDIVIAAPSDLRVQALVGLARPGMDYEFFQLLSGRMEQAGGAEKEKLAKLRERLLGLTREIDQHLEASLLNAKQNLNELLKQEDITAAMAASPLVVDDFMLQAINDEMDAARKKGDLDRIGRLQQIIEAIQRASPPPPEVELIEAMVNASSDDEAGAMLEANKEQITPEFLDMLMSFMGQAPENVEEAVVKRMQFIYGQAVRLSMQGAMKGGG